MKDAEGAGTHRVAMKIADVRATLLSVPLSPPIANSTHVLRQIQWVLVDILTDQGLTGHSHMLTFGYGPELLMGMVSTELRPLLLGQEAAYIGRIHEACRSHTEYIGQTGLAAWGLAAIDIALWDLLGQSLQTPVAKLLGACRDRVPIYGSGGWLSYSLDQLIEETTNYVRRGFKAVKMKVGHREVAKDVSRVKAVREALGGEVRLMVDANQAWSLEEARSFCHQTADLDLFWLEEPLPKDDVAGYARLGESVGLRIAAGEREYSLQAFRSLLDRRALSVVQPDVLRIGGITPWMKLAHLAEIFQVSVASHFYKEVDVHCMAAIPNGLYLEYFPWLDPLLIHPLSISEGLAQVPAVPGLALDLKPESVKEYSVYNRAS